MRTRHCMHIWDYTREFEIIKISSEFVTQKNDIKLGNFRKKLTKRKLLYVMSLEKKPLVNARPKFRTDFRFSGH